MSVIMCCLSDKFVKVQWNGRSYHFEHTAWAGWVPTTAAGDGARKNHPRGAWLELQRLHAPDIIV